MKTILATIVILIVPNPSSFQQTNVPATEVIEGVVRELNGGPIEGATVRAHQEADFRQRIPAVLTDSEGKFVLRYIRAGKVFLYGYKESAGYPELFFSFFATSNKKGFQTVEVKPGQVLKNVVLELGPKFGSLEVLIRDEQGNIIRNKDGLEVTGPLTFIREDDPDHPFSTGGRLPPVYLVPPSVPFRLQVEAEGYKVWRYNDGKGRRDSNLINLQSGETMSLNVILKKSR